MSGEPSDEFQQELVELFIQEAREWLQNIHVALDELQQGPPSERHASLIQTLTVGVTNLGGSAATINLPAVEAASFATLPLIDSIRDPSRPHSAHEFLSLCKQLGQIHVALTNATGVSFDMEGDEKDSDLNSASIAPADFLQLLRNLYHDGQSASGADKHFLQLMIEQMEAQVQAGVQQIGVKTILDYLDRISESEEAFVRAVDQQVSMLSSMLTKLSEAGPSSKEILETTIQHITDLSAEAQQVNAGQALVFFGGLEGLLSVILQHRVRLAAKKIDAITARLGVVTQLVHQWVERGRAEREAVRHVLPAR